MNLEYGLFSVRLHDYNQTLKVLFFNRHGGELRDFKSQRY